MDAERASAYNSKADARAEKARASTATSTATSTDASTDAKTDINAGICANAEPNPRASARAEVVASMANRLLWSRLHEVEYLQAKIGELARALDSAARVCNEIQAAVSRDASAAEALASVHLRGSMEVHHAHTFSEFFSAFMNFIVTPSRAQ